MFYREKINKKNYLVWLTTAPCDWTSCHEGYAFPDISACPSDCILPMLTHWLTHFLTQSSALHRVLDNTSSLLPPSNYSYPTCLSLLIKYAFRNHKFPLALVKFRYIPAYILGFITDSILAAVSDFLLLHLDWGVDLTLYFHSTFPKSIMVWIT